jgi:phenylacetate-CoA ligase
MIIGGDVNLANQMLSRARRASFYSGRLPDKPLRSLSELAQIPLTTKADLREHSPYGFLAVPKHEVAAYHESFGTTGKPVSIWLAEDDLLDTADEINTCGVNLSVADTVLIRYPYAISQVAHTFHLAARLRGACVIPASSRSTISPFPRIVNMMRYLDVTVLAALPLQAILLARCAELMGLSPARDFPGLRAICSAGEPLSPQRRKLIQEIWNAPVFDNYGMTEIGAAALDCLYGRLHPVLSDFVFELLEEDRETPLRPGNIGYLVVSTLKRRATPLVRYWTGDRARLVPELCPCGAQYRLEVRGRQEDCLQVAGHLFDLWDLEAMIQHVPGKGLWVVGPLEPFGLHFVVESREFGQDTKSQEALTILGGQDRVPIQISLVPPGTFFDPQALLDIGEVGKPRYIYSTEELDAKAYTKSLRL